MPPQASNTPQSAPHLQLHDQVHPLLPQRIDVVQDEGDDDVDAIRLMTRDRILNNCIVKTTRRSICMKQALRDWSALPN